MEFSICDNLKHQKRCLEVLFFLEYKHMNTSEATLICHICCEESLLSTNMTGDLATGNVCGVVVDQKELVNLGFCGSMIRNCNE